LQDATNDEIDNIPAHDVLGLSVGEPFAFASNKIVFTMKVQSLATVPAETEWPITFDGPDSVNYTVQMTTEAADGAAGTPIFQVFKTSDGPLLAPAADAASNFTPNGTITIVVPRSAIGNPGIGSQLNHFLTRISIAGSTITPDNMPNNLTPAGAYTIVGNAFCAPNTAPLATLLAFPHGQPANPPTGDPPLTIDFDASGSSDPDSGDTVASYTFDFGDGSAPVTQSTPTISHTYTSNGDFGATLKVSDSRGKISSNTALVNIGVELPLDRVVSDKLHGSDPTPRDIILYDPSVHPDGSGEVECRIEGTGYTIIYTFGSEFTVTNSASSLAIKKDGAPDNGVTVTGHGPGPGANQYQVHLSNVSSGHRYFVTLDGVSVTNGNQGNAPATLNDIATAFNVLIGDVNGDGFVLSGDYTATRQHSGSTVDGSTFRYDVNADGFILSGDYTTVRQRSGTQLP
jgi:hypothetical protein